MLIKELCLPNKKSVFILVFITNLRKSKRKLLKQFLGIVRRVFSDFLIILLVSKQTVMLLCKLDSSQWQS